VRVGLQASCAGGKRSGSAWSWSWAAPQQADPLTTACQTAHQRVCDASAEAFFRRGGKCEEEEKKKRKKETVGDTGAEQQAEQGLGLKW